MKGGGKKIKIHFTSRTKKKGITNVQKQIYFLADGALFFFSWEIPAFEAAAPPKELKITPRAPGMGVWIS